MRYRARLFLLMLFFSGLASAGTGKVEITGRGEASAAPDLATISVTTISLCYETSRDAKDANARLANQLVDILKKYKRGTRDKVTASGGPNVRQTEYIPVVEGRKILCAQKWRATNVLTLEISSLDSLPDLQDEILMAIDKAESPDPRKVAQTYANLSQPGFSHYPETHAKTRAEAQKKAWLDAKEQFNGFMAVCKLKSPKLALISTPDMAIVAKYGERHAGAEVRTPIIPEELSVQAVWRFVWVYEPTEECTR